jgi:DNA-directed RNA polymerase subunit RPC12/RpoP
MSEESKCNCQRCGQSIAFPSEMAGQDVTCPHCGRESTLLFPQVRKADPDPVSPIPIETVAIAESTLIACYVLSVLLPLVGFFCGVYLITKKAGGHGAACMAVSIFSVLVWAAILSSMD